MGGEYSPEEVGCAGGKAVRHDLLRPLVRPHDVHYRYLLQGLADKKPDPSLGPAYDSRYSPTVGS